MHKTTLAILEATERHKDKLDKAGEPYILHPLRVMFAVASKPPAGDLTLDEEMQAAVLHDTVEDTDLTLEEVERDFGSKVHRVVKAVTRCKSEGETYQQFILRIMADPAAVKIKLEDVDDNLKRINKLPEHERSIERRYKIAKRVLNCEGSWEAVARSIPRDLFSLKFNT